MSRVQYPRTVNPDQLRLQLANIPANRGEDNSTIKLKKVKKTQGSQDDTGGSY